MNLSEEQEFVVQQALDMIQSDHNHIFEFSGIAGSGKSTILNEIIRRSSVDPNRIMSCALTGQAVSVLQSKGIRAKTIHSLLYDIYEEECEAMNDYLDLNYTEMKFKLKNLNTITSSIDLLFIDEGGMIDSDMASELKSLNCKKIVSGDQNQLPPINGSPGFLNGSNVIRLTKPFRTDSLSGIYRLSHDIISNTVKEDYGNDVTFLSCRSDKIPEFYLRNCDVVLCCTNKNKEYYNKVIRNMRGFTTRLPCHGERIVFKKNNVDISINGISLVNGMIGTVVGESHMTSKNSFQIHFKSDLGNEIVPIKCDLKYFESDHENKKMIKSYYSKYAQGEYLEYAYAATIHSYQGSQASKVIFINDSKAFRSFELQKKLKYTAVTRAVDKLYWIGDI